MAHFVVKGHKCRRPLASLNQSGNSMEAERLTTIAKNITRIDRQVDYLENQSCRNNLRIDGIPEEKGETWANTEQNT